VTKWCVDNPIYVIFTSCEQENLYTTLDIRALGVLHFRLKYEPVFCVVKNVIFTSCEQENLYTTLNIRAPGVLHFTLKYEPVFCVVKYIKI